MHRKIELHDLVLYTINTSCFYQRHCSFAGNGVGVDSWVDHLRDSVLPLYAREIEPVTADYDTVMDAARELRDYYTTHIEER